MHPPDAELSGSPALQVEQINGVDKNKKGQVDILQFFKQLNTSNQALCNEGAFDWALRLFKRDFLMAWLIRGSISMIPQTLRMVKSGRSHGFVLALVEAYGRNAIGFGLFIASYFASYKLIEDYLRKEESLVRIPWLSKKILRTSVAGALASLALLLEGSGETRWLLAQYTAVRAGQCIYECFRKRNATLSRIGDWMYTAIFAVSSGQLVYSFALNPDTLDREYNGFLTRVTKMSPLVIQSLRSHLHDHFIDFDKLEPVVKRYYPEGLPISQIALMQKSLPKMIDCAIIHPEEPYCRKRIFQVWPYIFKMMFPVYASLHTVPPLVFGLKRVLKDPKQFINACLKNSVRSSSFMATYILIFQTLLCGHRELFRRGVLEGDHKAVYWLFGFLSSVSVLIEKNSRRTELALYLLPKAIVAFLRGISTSGKTWNLAGGDLALFSASMAIIMTFYKHEPESTPHVVTRILKYFI